MSSDERELVDIGLIFSAFSTWAWVVIRTLTATEWGHWFSKAQSWPQRLTRDEKILYRYIRLKVHETADLSAGYTNATYQYPVTVRFYIWTHSRETKLENILRSLNQCFEWNGKDHGKSQLEGVSEVHWCLIDIMMAMLRIIPSERSQNPDKKQWKIVEYLAQICLCWLCRHIIQARDPGRPRRRTDTWVPFGNIRRFGLG